MKKHISLLLSMLIVFSALFTALFISPVFAATTATKITSISALVDGKYAIATTEGVFMRDLDGTWVKPASATIDGNVASDPVTYEETTADISDILWDVTVSGSSVTLTDVNGTTIAPKSGNVNGIQAASYSWAVSETDGVFTFCGTGSDTTTLAYNATNEGFRAYKNATVAGSPAKYPSGFYLYKLDEAEPETSTSISVSSAVDSEDPTPSEPTEDDVVANIEHTLNGYKILFDVTVKTTPYKTLTKTPKLTLTFKYDINRLAYSGVVWGENVDGSAINNGVYTNNGESSVVAEMHDLPLFPANQESLLNFKIELCLSRRRRKSTPSCVARCFLGDRRGRIYRHPWS